MGSYWLAGKNGEEKYATADAAAAIAAAAAEATAGIVASKPFLVSVDIKNMAKASAIVRINLVVSAIRKIFGDNHKLTYSVYLVSCGAQTYNEIDRAPDNELAQSSFTTRANV